MKRKMLKGVFVAVGLLASVSAFAGKEEDHRVRGVAKLLEQEGANYLLKCDGRTGFCYTMYTNGDMDIYLGSRILHCVPALQSPPPQLVPDPTAPDTYTMLNAIIVTMPSEQQLP